MSRRPLRKGSVKKQKNDFIQWVKKASDKITAKENEVWNLIYNKGSTIKQADMYARYAGHQLKYELADNL